MWLLSRRLPTRSSVFVLMTGAVALCAAKEPLPLPRPHVPDEPPFPASVVTSGGQRLLLSQTDVSVAYDAAARRLVVNRSDWWLVNYPLHLIRGLQARSEEERCGLLFGCSRAEIRNWYLKTPGTPATEPPRPAGPAPVALSPGPAFVVDGAHPAASGEADGSAERPFRTIGAAVLQAGPGSVVRVRPGVYRESLDFTTAGTAAAPVKLEGVRAADGSLPVVSGNDRFAAGAWGPVSGLPGVWRAELFTNQPGSVSAAGQALKEASWPDRLQPGEFCFNRASHQFLRRRAATASVPTSGLTEDGRTWRQVTADAEGFVHLGSAASDAVLWLSTWVWVKPKEREQGVVWDPRFPEPITGKLACKGPFRAFRQTGTQLRSQVNKYRVWVNGTLCPSAWEPNAPRAHHNYGGEDHWQSFALNEGWNHLLFQFDTTTEPAADLAFRFGTPKGVDGYVCSAESPVDRSLPVEMAPTDHVSEALLLGPLTATPDAGVYVRLAGDADPNTVVMDLARRTSLARLDVPFVQVRGLEFRHGAYFQQRGQLTVSAEGCVVEGCVFRDSEVRGITVQLSGMDQASAPIIVRNNWVLNPGGLGIGASGSSDKLTAANQDGPAPGRGRLVCEYNVVVNNNAGGYPRFWESGGFKMFRLTGCILRNNTFIGGDGPAIWLDWEHYGNRVEGNISLDGTAFCVGVEASPGPNLVANNVAVNLKSGGVWFRHGILAWSSHAVWALHNTIDGRWNPTPAWQSKTGAGGIYLHEGGANRNTRWGAVPKRQAIVNNVTVGVDADDVMRRWGWNEETPVRGNVQDTRESPWRADVFRSPAALDYRLTPAGVVRCAGERHELSALVRHDFFGLLRHDDQPPVAGAFRVEPPVPDKSVVLIELEMNDGTCTRLYR